MHTCTWRTHRQLSRLSTRRMRAAGTWPCRPPTALGLPGTAPALRRRGAEAQWGKAAVARRSLSAQAAACTSACTEWHPMIVPAGQRAGRAISDMRRITDATSTNRSLESIRPSGARRPQLPATGHSAAARHLSSPCSMCCHARRWLAAKLQQVHEDRRGRSAAAASRGRQTQPLDEQRLAELRCHTQISTHKNLQAKPSSYLSMLSGSHPMSLFSPPRGVHDGSWWRRGVCSS